MSRVVAALYLVESTYLQYAGVPELPVLDMVALLIKHSNSLLYIVTDSLVENTIVLYQNAK